jgi:hypothetical protein
MLILEENKLSYQEVEYEYKDIVCVISSNSINTIYLKNKDTVPIRANHIALTAFENQSSFIKIAKGS